MHAPLVWALLGDGEAVLDDERPEIEVRIGVSAADDALVIWTPRLIREKVAWLHLDTGPEVPDHFVPGDAVHPGRAFPVPRQR